MSSPDLICTSDDMHPTNCNGKGRCVHCDNVKTADHDPMTCCLCDGESDPFARIEMQATSIRYLVEKVESAYSACAGMQSSLAVVREERDELFAASKRLYDEIMRDKRNKINSETNDALCSLGDLVRPVAARTDP